MIDFSPIKFDEHTLSCYVALFAACFPKSDKYSLEYLRWLYCKNPAGAAVGFDAWDGEKLAAHYVSVPADASVGGDTVKILLSLNTATHPAYQGKGLFTKLAERTYAAGAAAGFDCIYGVANANSTPGFVRKLGFQLVEPLEARIGIGRLNINSESLARNIEFERVWLSSALDWRCANPVNAVFRRKRNDLVQFHAAALGPFLPAYAELSSHRAIDAGSGADSFLPPSRLFLGLVPEGATRFHRYFDIPQRFRPSPLNFIYRSLSERVPKLERGHVSLSFLDFDAY
jgi:GNAT superfamily N-acetyltransferase